MLEEYNQLSLVIDALAGTGRGGQAPPVMALTATCKSEVREDVVRSLGLQGAEQVLGSMNRPQLGSRKLAPGPQTPKQLPPQYPRQQPLLCGLQIGIQLTGLLKTYKGFRSWAQ
ncbi:unnamed protein product [Effrenium voratum]|nr:unnamed protein product [Effrenium voratum]